MTWNGKSQTEFRTERKDRLGWAGSGLWLAYLPTLSWHSRLLTAVNRTQRRDLAQGSSVIGLS